MFHLWNLIISIIILLLLAGVITASIFAYDHNRNPRIISCPPCYADCTNTIVPSGQERCPIDPDDCTEGQCIFNYMNFSLSSCFIISPISGINSGNALFSELTTTDQATLVLTSYGETDNTGSGIAFTYDGNHIINDKPDGGNVQRLTIDSSVVIPTGEEFSENGFRVHHTTSTDTTILATFELKQWTYNWKIRGQCLLFSLEKIC